MPEILEKFKSIHLPCEENYGLTIFITQFPEVRLLFLKIQRTRKPPSEMSSHSIHAENLNNLKGRRVEFNRIQESKTCQSWTKRST